MDTCTLISNFVATREDYCCNVCQERCAPSSVAGLRTKDCGHPLGRDTSLKWHLDCTSKRIRSHRTLRHAKRERTGRPSWVWSYYLRPHPSSRRCLAFLSSSRKDLCFGSSYLKLMRRISSPQISLFWNFAATGGFRSLLEFLAASIPKEVPESVEHRRSVLCSCLMILSKPVAPEGIARVEAASVLCGKLGWAVMDYPAAAGTHSVPGPPPTPSPAS